LTLDLFTIPACTGDSRVSAASLFHRASGRLLRVFTDQPSVQLYTGNHLDGIPGKLCACYRQHSGVALEMQNFPDAINHVSCCCWKKERTKSKPDFAIFADSSCHVNRISHAGSYLRYVAWFFSFRKIG